MIDLSFVDTNVFIYSIDVRDPRKQRIARNLVDELMTARKLVLSTQVLIEFFHASTRKLKYPEIDALAAMDGFASADVVTTTRELVRTAAEISILEQQSVWDSLIIAAALQRRCSVLYSEDLGTGSKIRGLKVRNPFN
jgi:predicted nucleic acid-binding protein